MAQYIRLFSILGYTMFDAVGTPLNSHHGYQLFYVLEGKIAYIVDGKEFLLRKGECIIVPPFAEHGLVTAFDLKPQILDVQFTIQDVMFDKKARKICAVIHPENPTFKALIEIVVAEARKRQKHFYYIAQDAIEMMVLAMIDKTKEGTDLEANQYTNAFKKYTECTKSTIRYLEGFIAGNYEFNLDRVAKTLGYNKQYLCKTFANDVGLSIKQYLMMMRIEKAKELIDHTDYMLKDIADLLRFTSYVYFERMFKKYAGMTPAEYRNQTDGDKQYIQYSFLDGFNTNAN